MTPLENKFIRFLQKGNSNGMDIKEFMVINFIKPDPKSDLTINKTDTGVIFLQGLKNAGYIYYDEEALNHVNNWYVDEPPTIKRWFDTLHEPLLVRLAIPSRNPPMADINTHIKHIHNDSSWDKKWVNEFIIGFVYALFALLIGTLILKIWGVI